MANQNLSQFTEKLFVADADHTFIWDTAASISKRVSRNSWLNSGTLTSDAPVTISQTWNNAAVAFTGLKVNAAGTSGTNSAAASKFLDLQLNGVSKLSVDKSGIIALPQTGGDASALICGGSAITNAVAYIGIYGIRLNSTSSINWAPGNNLNVLDTILLRDGAANTLALRNGANAQTFNVYGTYTSGTSYERLSFSAPTAANAIIGTNKGSGGGTARGLEFQTDGVTRMTIAAGGATTFSSTVTATTLTATNFIGVPAGNGLIPALGAGSDFIKIGNNGGSELARVGYFGTAATSYISFGGVANTSPALKRSTTYLQARLADDSAFAPIQGKLTTDTAYTGTVVAATGYITIYDSTGTAYRVPCAL